MARRFQLLIVHAIIVFTMSGGSRFSFDPPLGTSDNKMSVYEGEVLEVCVKGGVVSTEVTVTITGGPVDATTVNTAIGGSDYVPSEFSLVFEQSLTAQIRCSQLTIIQDGLDESQEDFKLTLKQDNGNIPQAKAYFSIKACNNGDIILRSSRNPRFSTVEYCHNSSDWVTLCDGNWTAADATVVCTQAGKAGGSIEHYYFGEKIHNARMKSLDCVGNESDIDQCPNSTVGNHDCHPVLVDCGSSPVSSSGNTVVAAAVTVPLLLIVAGTSVCAAVIVIFFIQRRKKLKGKHTQSIQTQGQSPFVREACNSFNEQSAQLHQSSEDTSSTRWRRTANDKEVTIPNNTDTEPEEYSTPFVQQDRRLVLPRVSTTASAIIAKHHDAPLQAKRVNQEPRYEGCEILPEGSIKGSGGLNDRRVPSKPMPTLHPEITAQYSQLEIIPEEYSHLEHK